MEKTGHVRTILVLILVTGFLLVLFMPRSTSYERYTKKDIVNRFKDFSTGLSGNNPYIEPEEGADVSVVEMDREVLSIYKTMHDRDRIVLDKIIKHSRSENNFKFHEYVTS
jgi:hypothetical protein